MVHMELKKRKKKKRLTINNHNIFFQLHTYTSWESVPPPPFIREI